MSNLQPYEIRYRVEQFHPTVLLQINTHNLDYEEMMKDLNNTIHRRIAYELRLDEINVIQGDGIFMKDIDVHYNPSTDADYDVEKLMWRVDHLIKDSLNLDFRFMDNDFVSNSKSNLFTAEGKKTNIFYDAYILPEFSECLYPIMGDDTKFISKERIRAIVKTPNFEVTSVGKYFLLIHNPVYKMDAPKNSLASSLNFIFNSDTKGYCRIRGEAVLINRHYLNPEEFNIHAE